MNRFISSLSEDWAEDWNWRGTDNNLLKEVESWIKEHPHLQFYISRDPEVVEHFGGPAVGDNTGPMNQFRYKNLRYFKNWIMPDYE